MNVGEKIKKIRTAKLMTQKELAGTEITRNMLSRIENGVAQPSLGTLLYIAERLKVSPGFLLAGDSDELLYFKSIEMNNIKNAYLSKNFRLCRDMCQNSEWCDDELTLIWAESCLRVGVEEFCGGYLYSALSNFDEALRHCENTIYNTDIIKAEIHCYFSYMKEISPMLDSNVYELDGERIILADDFCIYSDIFCGMDADENLIFLMKQKLSENSSYLLHISARELMAEGDYANAKAILHRLLFEEAYELPEPMMYFVFCDFEICCKETNDFKGAYEYSSSKIALLQKLLGQ